MPSAREGGTLRVLVVARDPLVVAALRVAIGAAPLPMDVEHSDAPLEGIPRENLWDAVVVDPDGPPGETDLGGLDRVVAVTDGATEARGWLEVGAIGVVSRRAPPEVCGRVVMAAAEGVGAIDPSLLPDLFARRTPTPTEGGPELTPREREVLELVASGLSNRRIGKRLGISEHTAKFHVNAILTKLDADTRTEAVVLAAKAGWLLI